MKLLKKNRFFLFFLFIILIILVFLYFNVFKDKAIDSKYSFTKNENYYEIDTLEKEIINLKYQNNISNMIFNLKNDQIYSFDDPLFILNPYGTNVTGMYIYFLTLREYKVQYKISVDDDSIPDYVNTLSQDSKRFHEGMIIGLIQGMDNNVTISLYDNNNKLKYEKEFSISLKDYKTNSIKKIDSTKYVDDTQIKDGLYMFCNIDNSDDYGKVPLSFYDKNGILRAEFNARSGNHTNRVIFIDGMFLYSYDEYHFVLMDKFGKINKIYDMTTKCNHDYMYDKEKKYIIYVSGRDKIRFINLEDSSDNQLIDLKDIFSEYYNNIINNLSEEDKNSLLDDVDWAHLNSIEKVNEKDLILSLRENSSIVYLENVYNKPKIKYIISPDYIYDGTIYEKYLLKKVGDFPTQAGQHAVFIEYDKKLSKNEYYLYLFNNNYGHSDTINSDKWISSIEGVGTNNKKASNSYYYKYLINEKKKTFELVDKLDVPYSNAKSIVTFTDTDNHFIVAASKQGLLNEYDKDKKLLLSLHMDLYSDYYRSFKTKMNNLWFDTKSSYVTVNTKKVAHNSDLDTEKKVDSIFTYNNKTASILGMNSINNDVSESNIIYYDSIYFTTYDYSKEEITISSKIGNTEIKNIAGINLSNVKKIIIEEGIEKIGNYTFLGCDNLEEVVLPSTLKSIGDYAFVGCTNIKNITIPKSVKYIGSSAFRKFHSDQTIYFEGKISGFSNSWENTCEAVIIKDGE